MRRTSSLIATSLSASLVLATFQLAPAHAWAGQLEGPAAAEAPAEDPNIAEAKRLYKEGEVKFQTADYEDALVLWKKAFALLPDGEDTRAIRHALVYNIAEAHRRAYEVTRNPTHLRKAKILLENYRADHRALYGDEPEAVKERSEADDRIAELDKMIAESESKGETGTPLEEGAEAQPANGTGQPQQQPPPPTKPLSPQQQWQQDIKNDPVLGPKWSKSNSRVVGGAVMVGIGSVFALSSALLIAWGASLRADPNDFGLTGTGSLVTGGVFLIGGVALLVPGAIAIARGVKGKREVLEAKPRPTGMLLPYADPRGQAGATFVLRF